MIKNTRIDFVLTDHFSKPPLRPPHSGLPGFYMGWPYGIHKNQCRSCRGIYLFSDSDVTSGYHGGIFQSCIIVPKDTAYRYGGSEQDGFVSEQDGFVLEQNEFVSEQNEFVSEQNEFVSEQDEFVLEQDEFVLEQNEFVLEQDGFGLYPVW
jgi:hypothetical protein